MNRRVEKIKINLDADNKLFDDLMFKLLFGKYFVFQLHGNLFFIIRVAINQKECSFKSSFFFQNFYQTKPVYFFGIWKLLGVTDACFFPNIILVGSCSSSFYF